MIGKCFYIKYNNSDTIYTVIVTKIDASGIWGYFNVGKTDTSNLEKKYKEGRNLGIVSGPCGGLWPFNEIGSIESIKPVECEKESSKEVKYKHLVGKTVKLKTTFGESIVDVDTVDDRGIWGRYDGGFRGLWYWAQIQSIKECLLTNDEVEVLTNLLERAK